MEDDRAARAGQKKKKHVTRVELLPTASPRPLVDLTWAPPSRRRAAAIVGTRRAATPPGARDVTGRRSPAGGHVRRCQRVTPPTVRAATQLPSARGADDICGRFMHVRAHRKISSTLRSRPWNVVCMYVRLTALTVAYVAVVHAALK